MATYIKINGEYQQVAAIYKKNAGAWSVVSDITTALGDGIYFYNPSSIDVAQFDIDGPLTFLGKSFNVTAIYNRKTVFPTWSITSGSQYASINSNGKVTINEGVTNQTIVIQATYLDNTGTISVVVSYDNQLSINCPAIMTGTSGNVIARYNGTVVTPTWSITSGNSYASIDLQGNITIIASGTIVVSATYSGYTTTKTIELIYEANTSTETVVDPDTGTTTTTTTTTTQNQDGSTSTSSTTTITNEDGSGSETVTNTTQNQDGSSTSSSTTTSSDGSTSQNETTVNTDGSSTSQTTTQNADGTSQQSQTDTASDGSSATTTTNYNEDGDPTSGTNNTIDTSGNSNTQEVVYDENGDTTVTSYTIDTTGNQSGTGESISGDGINTEFLPWDNSDGWEMHIKFRSNQTEQPKPPIVTDTEDTGANLHFTLVCAKSPFKPWPGFHIRWTLNKNNYSSGNLVLGYTQANAASSTNRNLAKAPTSGANAYMYDFTISYDPTLKKYPSKFRCVDNFGRGSTISYNYNFDPIDYQFTIGYNINQQGNPYRYSNLTVYEFTINKL